MSKIPFVFALICAFTTSAYADPSATPIGIGKQTKAQCFNEEALLAEQFVASVQNQNYPAALDLLDRCLDFDLTTVETPTEAMTHTNCGISAHQENMTGVLSIILRTIRQVEISQRTFPLTNAQDISAARSFAITSSEKVLKALKAQLPADDERLVETLGVLADACFRAKEYDRADRYYSLAYRITTHYHAESTFTVHQCGRNFLANLKEVGRFDEADRLSKLKGDDHLVTTPLSPENQAFMPELWNMHSAGQKKIN